MLRWLWSDDGPDHVTPWATYDDDLAHPILCPACGRSVVHGQDGPTACGAPDHGQCRFGPDYARPTRPRWAQPETEACE